MIKMHRFGRGKPFIRLKYCPARTLPFLTHIRICSLCTHPLIHWYIQYPPMAYYWTDLLILDHSYLVGNLTINSKIAETKALEPLES